MREEAVQVPAGDPILGGSRADRQLLGRDLKNGDASSGHASDCSPTPGRRARRALLRVAIRALPPRRPPNLTRPWPGVTYVARHQGPITWDISPEARHFPLRCSASFGF